MIRNSKGASAGKRFTEGVTERYVRTRLRCGQLDSSTALPALRWGNFVSSAKEPVSGSVTGAHRIPTFVFHVYRGNACRHRVWALFLTSPSGWQTSIQPSASGSRTSACTVRIDRQGPDAVLGTLWGIDPQTITRQAIIATPTGLGRWAPAGAMHLVEFRNPLPPVRQGAKAWDLLPKNLDLYTTDMPTRYAELEAAGHRFRTRWTEMPAGQHMFREVQMSGHDEINVVLIETSSPGYDTTMSAKGYAGIGPLVTIVPDAEAETAFYRDVLGMATTIEMQLTGPDIERTAGLPPGAGLALRVFGDPNEPLGRIEIIEYQQLAG